MARTKLKTRKTPTKRASAAKHSDTSKTPKRRRRKTSAKEEPTLVEKAQKAIRKSYRTVRDHPATPVVAGCLTTAVASVAGTALYFKRFT